MIREFLSRDSNTLDKRWLQNYWHHPEQHELMNNPQQHCPFTDFLICHGTFELPIVLIAFVCRLYGE